METTTLDDAVADAVAVVNEAAKRGGSEGFTALLTNPPFRQVVETVLESLPLQGYRPTDDASWLVFSKEGLVQLGPLGVKQVICQWGEEYSGEVFNLSQLPVLLNKAVERHTEGINKAVERHTEGIKIDETVDRLLKAAPDVAAALTPEGVEKKLYLRRLLAHSTLTGDYSALAEAAATACKRLPFLYAHPELKSLPLANNWLGPQEKVLEGKRLEAVRERYPELRDGICQSMYGNMASQWNPLELLALTNGDLSFYDELEKGLGPEELFLYMEKDADGSQGEAFIGIRPYGRMGNEIQPHLKKLRHGALIGFYVMAQATVGGEKVAVIETMQTDLLRRDCVFKQAAVGGEDGEMVTGLQKNSHEEYSVPNRERRYYTSGKEHWLRRTLPKLEEALRGTGVKAVLIPTKEVIFATRNGGVNRLMESTSFEQLYQMPEELGYQKGTGKVDFLRGNSVEGMFWIKPLN